MSACFETVNIIMKSRMRESRTYGSVLYEGAKEMLLVDEVDNKEFLTGLFHAMYDELPAPKPKKRRNRHF